VDLVGARPARDRKTGADSGLDGYIYFIDDYSGFAKKVVVQVKSGHVGVNLMRDLKDVIEREKAAKKTVASDKWQVASDKWRAGTVRFG
jgi:site-specific DNA-methyltransferase (adenine-specific)